MSATRCIRSLGRILLATVALTLSCGDTPNEGSPGPDEPGLQFPDPVTPEPPIAGSVLPNEAALAPGARFDGECPVAVLTASIRDDPEMRVGTQVDWAQVGDVLILDGSGSYDPDGENVGYEWMLLETPDGYTNTGLEPFTPDPDSDAQRPFFLAVPGRYRFGLDVRDSTGLWSCDGPAIVTVDVAPPWPIELELSWRDPVSGPNDLNLHMTLVGEAWFSPADFFTGNPDPNWGAATPELVPGGMGDIHSETIRLAEPGECRWYAVGAHLSEQLGGTSYATVRVWLQGELVGELINRPIAEQSSLWDVGRVHTSGHFWVVDRVERDVDAATADTPELTTQMVESVAHICPGDDAGAGN